MVVALACPVNVAANNARFSSPESGVCSEIRSTSVSPALESSSSSSSSESNSSVELVKEVVKQRRNKNGRKF